MLGRAVSCSLRVTGGAWRRWWLLWTRLAVCLSVLGRLVLPSVTQCSAFVDKFPATPSAAKKRASTDVAPPGQSPASTDRTPCYHPSPTRQWVEGVLTKGGGLVLSWAHCVPNVSLCRVVTGDLGVCTADAKVCLWSCVVKSLHGRRAIVTTRCRSRAGGRAFLVSGPATAPRPTVYGRPSVAHWARSMLPPPPWHIDRWFAAWCARGCRAPATRSFALYARRLVQCIRGGAENDGHENDGPSKCAGMKLTDIK